MTQFIAVSDHNDNNRRLRLNVAAIAYYGRDPTDTFTFVALTNGTVLSISEGSPALDGLITNASKTAIVSVA